MHLSSKTITVILYSHTCTSLQSMAELDKILCVQSQCLLCATCNTICCTIIRGMPKERLSIRRMRVLGAFPAVLDDLNFKCSAGTPLVCSCFTIQFPKKKGYKQDYRQILRPLALRGHVTNAPLNNELESC